MAQAYKFTDLEILENLDSTHQGKTKIYVIKHNQKKQVCKAISKSSFIDGKSIEHIKNQKEALLHFTKLESLGINKIIQTFQDEQNLYIILQLVEGLPLHKLLQMSGPLNSQITRLIVSQIGLIMKQFHKEGYIYRDVKASNFLINSKGKVTMIDLGKAKRIGKQRTLTICGTTHSMPLQVYERKGYSYEFDYYSFGVLIYELLAGCAPFGYEEFSEEYLQRIKLGLTEQHLAKINCPIARQLIRKLMQNDLKKRLGHEKGFEEILQHEYFNCPEFLDYKDIHQECSQIDRNDERYSNYISEIQDFGLDIAKYCQLQKDDPFYKFYHLDANLSGS